MCEEIHLSSLIFLLSERDTVYKVCSTWLSGSLQSCGGRYNWARYPQRA